jgi:hypothetical protein
MESCSATLGVADIPAEHLRYLEGVLGHSLDPKQRVMLLSYTPGVVPDEATQLAAIDRIESVATQVAEYQRAQGITDAEIDAAVDEAIEHVRKRRRRA